MVCTLDRDRHTEIIKACRAAGARIMLLGDGDVAGVIAVSQPEAGVDIYMGSGGAPEGVLAAAALRCIGGQMQGRLMFENEEQVTRAREMGVTDPTRIYRVDEMARGNVMFAATGVTTGADAARRAPHGGRRGRRIPSSCAASPAPSATSRGTTTSPASPRPSSADPARDRSAG